MNKKIALCTLLTFCNAYAASEETPAEGIENTEAAADAPQLAQIAPEPTLVRRVPESADVVVARDLRNMEVTIQHFETHIESEIERLKTQIESDLTNQRRKYRDDFDLLNEEFSEVRRAVTTVEERNQDLAVQISLLKAIIHTNDDKLQRHIKSLEGKMRTDMTCLEKHVDFIKKQIEDLLEQFTDRIQLDQVMALQERQERFAKQLATLERQHRERIDTLEQTNSRSAMYIELLEKRANAQQHQTDLLKQRVDTQQRQIDQIIGHLARSRRKPKAEPRKKPENERFREIITRLNHPTTT